MIRGARDEEPQKAVKSLAGTDWPMPGAPGDV